jgi:hypothetical protein
MDGFLGLLLIAGIVGAVWYSRKKKAEQPTKPTPRSKKTAQPGRAEDLAFVAKGTDPETDNQGRVIVRLDIGSQIEIDLKDCDAADQDTLNTYIRGKSRGEAGDDGEKNVRMRLVPDLVPYWGGQCYRLETPAGMPAFEIRDHFAAPFELATTILREIDRQLRPAHAALADAQFVFDVAVNIYYNWDDETDDDGKETGGVTFDWDHAVMRIKDPLGIDIH